MGISKIIDYGEYKGIPIARDCNVFGEQVFIGYGEGCHTFWFSSVKDAKKFIDKYIDKINPTALGLGLIPQSLCEKCGKNEYACKSLKEKLKREALNP